MTDEMISENNRRLELIETKQAQILAMLEPLVACVWEGMPSALSHLLGNLTDAQVQMIYNFADAARELGFKRYIIKKTDSGVAAIER